MSYLGNFDQDIKRLEKTDSSFFRVLITCCEDCRHNCEKECRGIGVCTRRACPNKNCKCHQMSSLDYLNKVVLGDCLEIMQQLPDKSIDLVLTDPPYGIDYNPNWKTWVGEKQNKDRILGDDKKFDPTPLLEKYENIILFGANYYSDLLPIGDWIIWDKRLDENKDKMVGNPIEMAWYRHKTIKGQKIYRVLHGGVINDDSLKGNNQPRFHPTQKPVNLFKKILMDFTNEGDTILDMYAGSCTTAVACVQLKRNYICIEKEEKYVQICKERLSATTSQMF